MARNVFTNPATNETFNWPINHSEEEAVGKTRNITRSSTTDNVGAVRQQGDDGPLTMKLSGTILHRAQLVEFWRWFEISRTQTIYFTDFDAQSYEVQITEFSPLRNPRDDSAPEHYWTYTLSLDVYRLIDGDMRIAGVGP
jgi:hypothetical protein